MATTLSNYAWASDALQAYHQNAVPKTLQKVVNRQRPATHIRPETDPSPETLSAMGTHRFAATDTAIGLGNTGLTVTVSDLHIDSSTRSTLSRMRNGFEVPAYVPAGHATITGTSSDDKISLSQNQNGDTLLEVEQGGEQASFNLGQIAAVTIQAGDGADRITLNAKNYFGGITINGDGGDDQIRVAAQNALSAGITVAGGAGSDTIKISGESANLSVEGGAGNDRIYTSTFGGNTLFQRILRGNDGNDLLVGTLFADLLEGGAGNDQIYGTGGTDQLAGGTGDDQIHGNGQLIGGDGADTLAAQSGTLSGGDGDDLLYGTAQTDFLGGSGTDQFIVGGLAPHTLYATGQTGAQLDVMDRGLANTQELVPDEAISGYKTNLGDYDPTMDYLLDRNYLN